MTKAIPLIRSAVLFPMIRWLRENARPVDERLRAVDLGYLSDAAPERPVPLLHVFAFFRQMAREEGPDIAVRSAAQSGLGDLGVFGRYVEFAGTPREALARAATALPRYSSHEILFLERGSDGLGVRAGWSIALDDETLHLTQQFTAALVLGLCRATGRPDAPPQSVRLRPHPRYGVAHLRPWFGDAVAVGTEPVLEIDLPNDVLDRPLADHRAPLEGEPPCDWAPLKGDLSVAHSVKVLMAAMEADPPITLERLARSGSLSTRTLQRLLAAEGTCLRDLLDDMHRDRSLAMLPDTSTLRRSAI